MLTATPALFASVRTLLSLTEAAAPDAVLSSAVLGGAAELDVLGWLGLPAYGDRSEADQETIQTAVAYATAAYWLGSHRREYSLTGERFSSQYQWSGSATNVDGWVAELMARARTLIAPLIEIVPRRTPTAFRTASGRRGQSTY